ncbi:hypothetical protein PILCRDRAFT_812656 [Piloderma croceum F 1598]|uniref:Uncharacterized protein n=1 Tax=Piloderma croceum (strain F 1598) TaxID=765440 RepID=A0A0C3GDV3_PILCF|nr:hypothetical protein PILCRDRAFT_812656 [Piloderma croceum F 1598]
MDNRPLGWALRPGACLARYVDQWLIPEEPMSIVLNIGWIILSIGSSIGTGWISQQDQILRSPVLYSFARRYHLRWPNVNSTIGITLTESGKFQHIVLNLGISANWQTIDLTTMDFPAEMLIEYARVYRLKGQTNIGCDPPNYPTAAQERTREYLPRPPPSSSSRDKRTHADQTLLCFLSQYQDGC